MQSGQSVLLSLIEVHGLGHPQPEGRFQVVPVHLPQQRWTQVLWGSGDLLVFYSQVPGYVRAWACWARVSVPPAPCTLPGTAFSPPLSGAVRSRASSGSVSFCQVLFLHKWRLSYGFPFPVKIVSYAGWLSNVKLTLHVWNKFPFHLDVLSFLYIVGLDLLKII